MITFMEWIQLRENQPQDPMQQYNTAIQMLTQSGKQNIVQAMQNVFNSTKDVNQAMKNFQLRDPQGYNQFMGMQPQAQPKPGAPYNGQVTPPPAPRTTQPQPQPALGSRPMGV